MGIALDRREFDKLKTVWNIIENCEDSVEINWKLWKLCVSVYSDKEKDVYSQTPIRV